MTFEHGRPRRSMLVLLALSLLYDVLSLGM